MHRTSAAFLTVPGDDRIGLTVNLPPALKGRNVFGLPPYAPVSGYHVDKYPAAPADWPRTEGTTASYFIAVEDGKGMWLDFNGCRRHNHHVAVVVSIQGINPLTGRKTDKLELERYADDPQVEPWLRGYQNYLASTCTPDGLMWIDGFRAQDGTVRQYVFTKDESKGVAAQLIGVDRVFAIGASFFLSKEPKPKAIVSTKLSINHEYGSKGVGSANAMWVAGQTETMNYCGQDTPIAMAASCDLSDIVGLKGSKGAEGPKGKLMSFDLAGAELYSRSVKPRSGDAARGVEERIAAFVSAPVERLEISAGAQIQQQLYKDASSPEFWNPTPFGTVVVNYAPAELVKQILAAGETPASEGFLDGIDSGNV